MERVWVKKTIDDENTFAGESAGAGVIDRCIILGM